MNDNETFDFDSITDKDEGFDFDAPESEFQRPNFDETPNDTDESFNDNFFDEPSEPVFSASKEQPDHINVRQNTLPDQNVQLQDIANQYRNQSRPNYGGNSAEHNVKQSQPKVQPKPQQQKQNTQQDALMQEVINSLTPEQKEKLKAMQPAQRQHILMQLMQQRQQSKQNQQGTDDNALMQELINTLTPQQKEQLKAMPADKRQQVLQKMLEQYKQLKQAQQAQQKPPKKKKSKKLFVIIGIILLIVILVIVAKNKKKEEPTEPTEAPVEKTAYEVSGKYAYDTLLQNLNTFSAEGLDKIVGTTDGDSYLAQEWAYANNAKIHCDYITFISGKVAFEYPMIAEKRTDGSETGNQVESMMNNGEAVKVTIPDYAKIAEIAGSDGEYIRHMVETYGYKPTDYTWDDELANILFQYVMELEDFPTKQVDLSLLVGLYQGSPIVQDDAPLDDLLFGSEDFHNLVRVFDQQISNYTGFKDEVYYEDEEQPNPEYEEWVKLFNQYYTEDKGIFNRNTSKWEPWYVRDADNNIIYDENGEKIVNYYSIKDENGKDWIEPDKTIMVPVEKHRDVPDEWVEEKNLTYSHIGTHYIQTDYKGRGVTAFRVGDGSKGHPAGIGTPVITKILCTDGKYHDVKVAMKGYWVGQDAIDYAEMFDTRNRGFTTASVVKLICYEIQVENLEEQPITFNETEIGLSDRNSNISSRTGTMYGFSSGITLQPHEAKILNDWSSSTELEQKYAVWGKTFGRQFPMVYFDCLAGTGYIPTYSAYKAFTGESSIDTSVKVNITEQQTTTEQPTVDSTESNTELDTEE